MSIRSNGNSNIPRICDIVCGCEGGVNVILEGPAPEVWDARYIESRL